MSVQFAPEVRRLIVTATMLAETRSSLRPRLRDLADAAAGAGIVLPSFPGDALDDDVEDLVASAADMAGGGAVTLDVFVRAASAYRPARTGARASGERGAVRAGERRGGVVPGVRVGIGYDSHRFASGGPMVLGGVRIESSVHCAGHSDGDAVAHAVADAILGAANAGDIGEMFPDTDPVNRGRNSLEMLHAVVARVSERGWIVSGVDFTVVAEHPRIGPHRDAMRAALAPALGVDVAMVSAKGKSNEGMGWIGRGEGLAVFAVATLLAAPR